MHASTPVLVPTILDALSGPYLDLFGVQNQALPTFVKTLQTGIKKKKSILANTGSCPNFLD